MDERAARDLPGDGSVELDLRPPTEWADEIFGPVDTTDHLGKSTLAKLRESSFGEDDES